MSSSTRRSDLIMLSVLLAVGAVAAAFLVSWYSSKAAIACDGRVSGAATPTEAVTVYLDAVASTDERLACSVLAGRYSAGEVREGLLKARQHLNAAGLSSDVPLDVTEMEQLGSTVAVRVSHGEHSVEVFVRVVSYPTFQTFYRVEPLG